MLFRQRLHFPRKVWICWFVCLRSLCLLVAAVMIVCLDKSYGGPFLYRQFKSPFLIISEHHLPLRQAVNLVYSTLPLFDPEGRIFRGVLALLMTILLHERLCYLGFGRTPDSY